MATGAPDWWIQGIIPMKFINLSDTPGDYIDRAGLVPEVNAGEDALAWSANKIDDHAASHEKDGTQEITHNDLDISANDHHTAFTAAMSRAAINDIFGADGFADKDIHAPLHHFISGRGRFGILGSITLNHYTQNAYWDDPDWRYMIGNYACRIVLDETDGSIKMYTAPSGVADAIITFTLRFTLDVNGHLTSTATFNGVYLEAPVTISPGAFVPADDQQTWLCVGTDMKNRADVGTRKFYASVNLPHGLTVSELKLYGYRNDVASQLQVTLERNDFQGGSVVMATVDANWTSGASSLATSTITSGLIDNTTYSYFMELILDPNDSVEDVRFFGAKVSFA